MILIAQDMFETFEIPWVFNREAAMKNEKKKQKKTLTAQVYIG